MRRISERSTFFVCCAVSSGELISKTILSMSKEEAASLFFDENKIYPKEILGPFFKKTVQKEKIDKTKLKFSNKTKKAQYNDWEVNAFLLDEPKNHAYLIFTKRIDNKAAIKPKDLVIDITELRII